jgi:ATP-dependent protease ClpP protease subunit
VNKEFWNFKNISESEGELTLYGDIAESSWYGDTISSKKFAKDLKALGDIKNLEVRINSGGGDVFAGHAIYAMLKDHPANVTVKIDGLAASAASVIAMAGNEIVIPSSSFMMIHNPSASSSGNANDFVKMSETLNVIKDGIVNAYADKTGKDKKTISQMMDNETWMTGEDAVREGFADTLEPESKTKNQKPVLNGNILIVNGMSHDLSNIKTRPNIKNELENKESNSFSFLDKILNIVKGNSQMEGLVNNILQNNLPKTNQKEGKQEVEEDMEIKNVEELRKTFPDLVNEIEKTAVDSAVGEAIKNERSRIQDIEKISNRIDPILVNKAKFEDPIDAKELAFQAMQSDSNRGKTYLKNLKDDASASGTEDVTASTTDVETEETKKAAENKAIENISAGANGSRRRGRK